MSEPPPQRRAPQRMTVDQARQIKRKLDAELSPDERSILNEAGGKLRFWTNVGIGLGFLTFSLPYSMRTNTRFRFVKGLMAGTFGVFLLAPVGIMYGGQRAQEVIRTHPNNKHLLQVLEQTKARLLAGEKFDGSGSESQGMVNDSADSWPSDRQNAYPSNTNDKFDEDELLTDDEINRQDQGATFTPPNRGNTGASSDKSGSAWDELRNKAARQNPPSQQPQGKKENDVWGEDK